MYRTALKYLKDWQGRETRMPLVLRGARQTGKTHLVRMFAEECFEDLIEVNLEESPQMAAYFKESSPREIVAALELHFDRAITPGRTLLFLDEIQAAPDLFAKLRYFHERLPALHVVSAGSLLEFVLEEHDFSMPVGRIEYLHLGPMTFEEFLGALSHSRLVEYLATFSFQHAPPEPIHQELMALFRLFLFVGGMPKAVAAYANTGSLRECEIVRQSILATYVDDFRKYGKRVRHELISKVFFAVPRNVGRKFRYVNVSRDDRPASIARALHLLELARVCYAVHHCTGRGLPLSAEGKSNRFKVLFLDVGLLLDSCGLTYRDVEDADDLMLINEGAVCEQSAGQHLLYRRDPYREPELHYWAREKPSSSAEVDYIISIGGRVVPIEIKAGKTGTLRSLHGFVHQRGLELGVRFNADAPSVCRAQGNLPTGEPYDYELVSLPLYLIGQVERLVRARIHGVDPGNARGGT